MGGRGVINFHELGVGSRKQRIHIHVHIDNKIRDTYFMRNYVNKGTRVMYIIEGASLHSQHRLT